MRRICSLFLLLFYFTQCLATYVLINVHESGSFIVVSLINVSQENIKVDRLFTENSGFGLVELYVTVHGRRFGPLWPPSENFPKASDYIDLPPLDTVGKAFYISEIRRIYRVGKSCFDLQVAYHDIMARKFGAYSSTILSNKISVCEK